MSDTTEPLAAVVADYRKDITYGLLFEPTQEYISRLLDRVEAAAEREREETKDYFAKLHDGPSMICTAKNCSLRNAAEDIVEQVKAEASFGHFAPVVVEDRPVGNAAAMRDLLEKIRHEYGWGRIGCRTCVSSEADVERVSDLFEKQIDAALAAPARNCDRFATANDAVEGYIAAHPHDDEPDASAYGSWLFAPAEGGKE